MVIRPEHFIWHLWGKSIRIKNLKVKQIFCGENEKILIIIKLFYFFIKTHLTLIVKDYKPHDDFNLKDWR